MTTLPTTAEPSDLNTDLAEVVMAGRVTDALTGAPIPGDRKRARALAGTPCRRILTPRAPADGELDAITDRLGELRLRHREAVVYDAEGGASVLVVSAARPEVGSLVLTPYRRAVGGEWSTDRVTVSHERGCWSINRVAPLSVGTPAEAEAVRTFVLENAMATAGVLLTHVADTRAAVDRFYESATTDEFCRAVMGCSIEDVAVRILESGGRAVFRMTLPPV